MLAIVTLNLDAGLWEGGAEQRFDILGFDGHGVGSFLVLAQM